MKRPSFKLQGLNDLQELNESTATSRDKVIASKVTTVSVSQIQRNPKQPRKTFNPVKMDELESSIAEHGVLQPLLVRSIGENHYELIAGERRWQCAKKLNIDALPVVIYPANEETVLIYGLIENIQRENLNPIEEAFAYQELLNTHKLTHEILSEKLGKPRTSITNYLRLLRLEPQVQTWLSEGKITLGHAKVLLALTGIMQVRVCETVIEKVLSVRQTEAFIQKLQSSNKSSKLSGEVLARAAVIAEDWSVLMGHKVKIKLKSNTSGNGTLKMDFNTMDDLDDLFTSLSQRDKHEFDSLSAVIGKGKSKKY